MYMVELNDIDNENVNGIAHQQGVLPNQHPIAFCNVKLIPTRLRMIARESG